MPAIKPFVALCVAACAALCIPPVAEAAELQRTEQPVMYFGGVPGKAVVDTIDLMGPGGLYPVPRRLRVGRGTACRRRLPAPRVALGRRDQPVQSLACRHLWRRVSAERQGCLVR
jgi:hypothetical protein